MTIAVNLTQVYNNADHLFFIQQFETLAANTNFHQFIFIVSNQNIALSASENIAVIVSSPRANTPLMWKLWYNYTLPALLKKNAADILVQTAGICSLRCRIKQYLFINEAYFAKEATNHDKKYFNFIKKNAGSFLDKASTIVTTSIVAIEKLLKKYKIEDQKITVLKWHVNEAYYPAEFYAKEGLKDKYTGGKEFFLFKGIIDNNANLINLFKAFSFFKQRQKSNMQLLIIEDNEVSNEAFGQSLKSYKYRDEVKLFINLKEGEAASIMSAAYAFFYPVTTEGFHPNVLKAIQCQLPMVLGNTYLLREFGKDAAVYIDPSDFNDIAQKMMLVFKDENKRSEMVKVAGTIASAKWDSVGKTLEEIVELAS